MLTIHFFNVGHGDSMLLSYEDNLGNTAHVVIDSKNNSNKKAPVYEYLKKNNIKVIDLLVVTHFHTDHFQGLDLILNESEFKVLQFMIPPLVTGNTERMKQIIKKYGEKIMEVKESTSDENVNSNLKGIARILEYIIDHETDNVFEGGGKADPIKIPNAPNLSCTVCLPIRSIKGVLQKKILDGEFDLNVFPEMNDASVVLLFEYAGKKILLTGDSTLAQWNEHKRLMRLGANSSLDIVIFKSAHHGSKYDNNQDVYEYLLNSGSNDKIMIVSADGESHPDKETFDLVNKFNIKPYCTSLSSHCISGDQIAQLVDKTVPVPAQEFIRHYKKTGTVSPCQGDITLEITPLGAVSVYNSTGSSCIYGSPIKGKRILL